MQYYKRDFSSPCSFNLPISITVFFKKIYFHVPQFHITSLFYLITFYLQRNIKKIRNNISKSNVNVKPRCLQANGNTIIWAQFKEAYNWDQSNLSLPVHERLSELHFELDSAANMRNHLADVLDRKMLFLMQVC